MPNLATQVRDNPVEGVTPAQGVSDASMSAHADAGSFGGQVGQAEQNMGEQVGQVAQHFQNIYAESTARDATTNAVMQMSDAEAKYTQLKGNDAVAGLKPFQQQIVDIIKNNSQNLSPVATQMFQNDAARIQEGAIFRAGSHAGEQAYLGQISSLNGSLDVNKNLFAMNADNPTGSLYLSSVAHTAGELGTAQNLGPDAKQALITKHVGEAGSAGIMALTQSNPDKASELFDKLSKSMLTYEDVDKDGKLVQYQIPYLDAEQRAKVTNDMQREFKTQAQNALWDSQSAASKGDVYNKDELTNAMKRVGTYTDSDIQAHIQHLDNLQTNAGSGNAQYDVEQTIKNNEALAFAGKEPIDIDPAKLQLAFRKKPDKVQAIISQQQQLHQVASFRIELPTMTAQQADKALRQFVPSTASPIDFVMEHEGGYVTNDSGKGPTNFGINQESNPDIDVKNLTQEQARDIVKKRYADKIGADQMSPALAAVAVDSAVNMGVNKTQKLLAEANGDPQKLIDLRRTEYQRLATENPDKYGKYLQTWNARLDDLQKQLPNFGQTQNFAAQSQLYGKLVSVTQDYYKQLYSDPAGTITQNDSRLGSMFQDAVQDTKNPQKMVDYVNMVAARQENLQIPEENRSVLPKAYAVSVANSLIENPEQAPKQLAKMAQQYGSNWPQVYKSLVQQGDMNPAYQLLAQLGSDPKTAKFGTYLGLLLGDQKENNKTDEILMGGEKPLKILKSSVSENPDVKNLTLSLARSRVSPQQIENTVNGIQKLAIAIHVYDPSDGNPTATAIKSITSKYAYLPSGNARVPADKFDTISANVQTVMDNIADTVLYPKGYQDTYANRQQYIHDIMANGSWISSDAENKIYLVDNNNRPVLQSDGKQISVGYNDPLSVSPRQNTPSELIQQPSGNLGAGEIARKGSIADIIDSNAGKVAGGVGHKISETAETLEARAKEKSKQPSGLVERQTDNVGAGEIPRKGSILDILGGQ